MFSFSNPAGADHRGAGGSDGGGDAVGSLDGSQSSHSNPTDPGRLASTSAGEASACLQFCIQTSCLSSRRCARIPAGCWRRGNPLAPLRRGHKSPPGSEAAALSDPEPRRIFPWNGGCDPRSGPDLALASRKETGEHPRCGMSGRFGSEQRGCTSRKAGRERIPPRSRESRARRSPAGSVRWRQLQDSSPLPVPLLG